MAPDLNSVAQPARPISGIASTHASRRTSQIMPPPTIPLSQQARRTSVSSATSESIAASQAPIRHPRPMTPAELHSDMEKEQEGIVNRLSRELTALRAHAASVASNASSTSSYAIHDGPDLAASAHTQQSIGLVGATYPTVSRRHRGSSSSSYSNPPPLVPPSQSQPVPIGSTSQASVDRARDAAAPLARSRQNSTVLPPALHPQHSGSSSSRPSPSPSPGLRHSHPFSGEGAAYFPPPSHAGARPTSTSLSSSTASLHHHATSGGNQRVEDAAAARQALEQARLENEALVRRVKELEREVRRTRRARDEPDASPSSTAANG